MIYQEIDLNMIPEQSPTIIHVDQYDHGINRIRAHLYEGDVVYTPTSGSTAIIQGRKPDGHGFAYTAYITLGSWVYAELTEQMTAVAGDVRTQLVVTEPSGRTGSFAFIIRVQPSALPDDTDLSESDLALIEQGIEAGQQAVTSAAAAAASATSAANSATAAAASATAAATSESNALSYKNAAESAKNRAVQAEANAGRSEGEAAISASEAEASARRSATSAGEASDSATAAEAAETATETLKNGAATFALAAKNYRDEAEAWAVGKKEGEDVPSTDPTFHNNSEWYAMRSEGSAASASSILGQVRTAGAEAVAAIEEAADEATPEFTVNLSDGHLYYTGGRFDFVVDSNGHLTWQITA